MSDQSQSRPDSTPPDVAHKYDEELSQPPASSAAEQVSAADLKAGAAERFLTELRAAVETVRASPAGKEGTAPVYGMATNFPARGAVAELLRRYIERLYRP